jgi:RTX calcium-binding nonapeptide repeat (4 copies)
MAATRKSRRRARMLIGAALASFVLLALSPNSGARTRCSFSGSPQNLLTVTADREALGEITRRGERIVVAEFLERPRPCRGGVPTVRNTDTIRVVTRGDFDFVELKLGGGPFAPGATPEARGASEIEVQFRGFEPLGTVVGTRRADAFEWNRGGAHPGLNLNRRRGDTDVDVTVTGAFGFLVAEGAAGDDRIVPAHGAALSEEVWADGGPGDDLLIAHPRRGGVLGGGTGNDVLTGGSTFDELTGGAGNDRVVGAGGGDLIRGAPGRDLILAGPGPDRINSSDSHRDRVRCGEGRDRVTPDRRDRLRGCEVIRRG